MQMTGNTILVTGGGSGIGRGLAEALLAAGNHVIVAGRRAEALAEVVAANPGMASATLDVTDPAAITAFAAKITRDHPALNVLFNNAGMMKPEDLMAETVEVAVAEETITTNLLGPIRLTAALLPHLRRQKAAAILNTTSGLAFVPRADAPTYSATKAALHSYTQALRHQLRDTAIEVIEVAPPLVATDIAPYARTSPRALPLDAFVAEVMALLAGDPPRGEVLVERVRPMRYAEATGDFDKVFAMVNG